MFRWWLQTVLPVTNFENSNFEETQILEFNISIHELVNTKRLLKGVSYENSGAASSLQP